MGYEPLLHIHFASDQQPPPALEEQLQRLATLREKIHKSWRNAVETQAKGYNKRHQPIAFKTNDLVVLATKDLRLKLPSKKLSPRFLGPFQVAKAVSSQAYRLWLPSEWRIYDIFNISRLEPYEKREGDDAPKIPSSVLIEDNTEE